MPLPLRYHAKVLVTFPDRLLQELDAVAILETRNRNDCIREIVRKYITSFQAAQHLPTREALLEAAAATRVSAPV